LADCNMCWNTWNTLEKTPFPLIPEHVEVCRNCARSMKQVIAFARHHGLDLITGELGADPQAGSETQGTNPERQEPPRSPSAKKAAAKA